MALFVHLAGMGRAGTLTGTFTPIAAGSNVNLTAEGKLDWVHWGLYTADSLDRKADVAPQISNFTLVGDNSSYTLAAYQYTNNANGYTWYDGVPTTNATNTPTGVWAYDYVPFGSGFQLTVPADTAQRTLQVFVGAFAAEGQFTAFLSDGSAPNFTNAPNATVNNTANGPGGVFTINFAADSSNQTLTVIWTLAKVYGSPLAAPNVTLQAAALTASNADNPPYVAIASPENAAAFPAPATITLSADALDFDGTVTNVAFYSGTNLLGQVAASPYSFTWANVPKGHYTVTALAADNGGASGRSQPVDVFVYGAGGGQTNAVAQPPSSVDLTAEGTADWTHWGLTTNTSFDYKSSVPRQIGNFTELGTNAVQQYSDNYTAFSWSDGAPTSAATNTATGVFVTGQTNGFLLTAPADLSPRQLRVYVGGYGAQGEFQAWLSDLSAPPFDDTSVSNVYGNSYAVYTINYTAASTNQQLIVRYRAVNLFDLTYGNVTLQAATLQGAVPPPPPAAVQIVDPRWLGSGFALSFQTQTNQSYTVQYTYSLNPVSWQTLTNFSGNGTMTSVTNQAPTNATCFYRVLEP
ncbi:MAG: hypothetical protein KGJ60_04150 [Verrucomicrobiota bacterium]|nr:hypothetical protein [Verrucomicrobiota bacterium]